MDLETTVRNHSDTN